MKEQEITLSSEMIKKRQPIVMKFGGSAMENAERIYQSANIVVEASAEQPIAVVVSAMYGVTDRLFEVIGDIKSNRQSKARERIDNLYKLHVQAASELDLVKKRPLAESLNRFISDLFYFIQLPRLQPYDEDFIVSYGERLSYLIFAGVINEQGGNSQAIDATSLIVTNNEYKNAHVDLGLSQVQANAYIKPLIQRSIVPVTGGFYGLSYEGRIAVLGRNTSDYSAAVLAYALDAGKLVLWKEVGGIYSSDPKVDSSAEFLPEASYDQAKVLGPKIIHPECIDLLRARNIPIEVKNFKNPHARGSRINGEVKFEGR